MARLERSLAESVAVVPAALVNTPEDDLVTRFASVLQQLGTRQVGAATLMETLRLEALDWGLDHGVGVHKIELEDAPAETGPSLDNA